MDLPVESISIGLKPIREMEHGELMAAIAYMAKTIVWLARFRERRLIEMAKEQEANA